MRSTRPGLTRRVTVLAASVAATASALVGTAVADPAPAHAYYDYYGALALSPSTGSVGRALDYGSYAAASAAATRVCPADDCRVVAQFVNGCGAIASSPSYWGYGTGSRLYTAQANALYYAGGGSIYYWGCTSGHG
ncbi:MULTISPECIES: DUF4189 domain-containing protein [Gordonia]|uniref:DUF4189 domain-containing protein n=1 Tax=Gordonia TaxID=2053 RepID=UPI000AD76210|nr:MULTISPECIES: DUF4189 domain-containing protein [Gordonia]UPW11068.1 DUF4189 domain-containing protein [Gordonia terrae]